MGTWSTEHTDTARIRENCWGKEHRRQESVGVCALYKHQWTQAVCDAEYRFRFTPIFVCPFYGNTQIQTALLLLFVGKCLLVATKTCLTYQSNIMMLQWDGSSSCCGVKPSATMGESSVDWFKCNHLSKNGRNLKIERTVVFKLLFIIKCSFCPVLLNLHIHSQHFFSLTSFFPPFTCAANQGIVLGGVWWL